MIPKEYDFSKVIPPEFLKRLGKSYNDHKLGIVLVVSNEVLTELNANKTALLSSGEGSTIILVPINLIEELYR